MRHALDVEPGVISSRRKARQRLPVVQRFLELRRSGVSWQDAAAQLGYSEATLSRWSRAMKKGGLESLRPGTWRSGRPSVLRPHLTPEIVAHVGRLALQLRSPERAWREFARTPGCPPAIARALRNQKKGLPSLLATVVRLKRVKHVTAYQLPDGAIGFHVPRCETVIIESSATGAAANPTPVQPRD